MSRSRLQSFSSECIPLFMVLAGSIAAFGEGSSAQAAPLRAGAAKIDISNPDAGPPSPPMHVRALVLSDGTTTFVMATVDAVAIGEIGPIRSDYLATVRTQLQKELKIPPRHVAINASHCHGIVCSDVAERTVQAVREAMQKLVPVTVGAGRGSEDRIQENRRLKLRSGREADVRHAYSLPPDEEVVGVGPIDPEIGILRIDRKETGQPLAMIYNFACHPIQGVPSGKNTADMTGFSSQVIEETLGQGAIALFVQGCGGDINPIGYKEVAAPRNAETLGNLLALSTLKGVRQAVPGSNDTLKVINEPLVLPRADFADPIDQMEKYQQRLLGSLSGTSLNFKTFLPLVVRYNVSAEFPSFNSHRYLNDRKLGRDDYDKLDAENRRNMEQYLRNIHTMEELTRVQTNLALLRKHQAQNLAAGKRTLDVELVGLRVGEFVLVTFPGELTVQIGLNLKRKSPHPLTFIAGYTNGYIYYAPTAEQLLNAGGAQEDCDSLLAPEWQGLFEAKAEEILRKL